MASSSKLIAVHLVIVLSLAGVLSFYQLGRRALVDPDEPRYAEGAREMLEMGEWITPKFNYADRLDKPILFYWFVMAAYTLFGITEFAARLFPALFAVYGVVLTYFLGALLFSSRAGLLSAVMLATSPLYFTVGRLAITDMVFSTFVFLALGCFCLVYFFQQRSWTIPFFIALGLAMLTKGPVGIALVFLIILVFLGLRRDLRWIRNLRIGWGVFVFLLVTLPWFVLLMARHEGLLRYYFYDQTIRRFFTQQYERSQPLFYYFYLIIPAFFPWIVLFVTASCEYLRKGVKEAIATRPRELMLWFWGVLPVLFFSVSQSQLPTYILPAFPGLALFVGQWVDRELLGHSQRKQGKRLLITCVIFCCGIVAGYIVAAQHHWSGYHGYMPGVLAAGAVAFVCGLAGLGLSRGGRLPIAFWLLVAGMIVIELGTMPAIDSYLTERRSLKALGAGARPDINPDAVIIRYHGEVPPSSVFYLRHCVLRVDDVGVLALYTATPGVVYILTKHHNCTEAFLDVLPRPALVAADEEYCFVASRASPW